MDVGRYGIYDGDYYLSPLRFFFPEICVLAHSMFSEAFSIQMYLFTRPLFNHTWQQVLIMLSL